MRPEGSEPSRGFERRMLLLACVVALAAAGLPTAWWYARATHRAEASAASWAARVAREVERDALRSPLSLIHI